jgi:hypothetical protein
VVAPGVTVIGFPVPINVVPHPPVYQYTVPTAPWAVSVADDPGVQIVDTEDEISVGALGAFVIQVKLITGPAPTTLPSE